MGSLLIRGARLIDPADGRDEIGDILVSEGKIEESGGRIRCGNVQEISARGLIAAPGLVDLHVHLRDPGFTEKEDILTGCKAATAGGVTSVLCMPNTSPTADSPDIIQYILEKAADADARVYPAAAITKGLKSEELCDLKALKTAGAAALSDDGCPVVNTALMAEAMRLAPGLGLKVMSHCEDLFLSTGES